MLSHDWWLKKTTGISQLMYSQIQTSHVNSFPMGCHNISIQPELVVCLG